MSITQTVSPSPVRFIEFCCRFHVLDAFICGIDVSRVIWYCLFSKISYFVFCFNCFNCSGFTSAAKPLKEENL